MEAIERAVGSLLGLFVGDAFGAQTEFDMQADIMEEFPQGILEMDSKERNIGAPGMITDDSEMAIMLATSLIHRNGLDVRDVRRRYLAWLNAEPSDLGTTILEALKEGRFNPDSQANGALMRLAPLAIYGTRISDEQLIGWVDKECAITHIHEICRDANRIWAFAIAKAVKDGCSVKELYSYLCSIAPRYTNNKQLLLALHDAVSKEPQACDDWNQGWVLIAFQQALYTLLHTSSIVEGIRSITNRGGDADTNAAIYGMLAGAIEGRDAIPRRWVSALLPTRCLHDLLGESVDDMERLAETLVEGMLSIE